MKQLLYLSGPITGDKAYRQKFKAIEQQLTSRGYAVVNPAELEGVLPTQDMTWAQIMDFCLDILARCDYMVQMPGWENSLGCQQEYGFARGSCIPVLPVQEFLKN